MISMGTRIFLLSPASCAGNRARLLLAPSSRSALAERLRADTGVPIGEVFTFISQLYFRGKLAYARAFARTPQSWTCALQATNQAPQRREAAPQGRLVPQGSQPAPQPVASDGVFVITTSRGLVDWRQPVTADTLREFAGVELRLANDAYIRPLQATARSLAERLDPQDEVVLLGSIASDKYAAALTDAFGVQLRFPKEFVGRGDMSRGGLLLRRVEEGRELEYVPVDGSVRHGARPPRLERRR